MADLRLRLLSAFSIMFTLGQRGLSLTILRLKPIPVAMPHHICQESSHRTDRKIDYMPSGIARNVFLKSHFSFALTQLRANRKSLA